MALITINLHRLFKTFLVMFLLLLMPPVLAMNSILVLNSSDKNHYEETLLGISDESENEFSVNTVAMNDAFSLSVFEKHLNKEKPEYLILIGNKAAMFYYRYYALLSDKKPIPAVIVSSIFSDKLVNSMSHTMSIRYEVPLPIVVSQLRYHLDRPIKNVGVMYRSWMKEFIDHNQKLGELEKVNLIRYPISDKASPRSVAHNFKLMIKNKEVDAVWFLHDDYFATIKNLKALKPLLDKNKLPVFTNTNSLVAKNMGIGMFSVTADQYGLGVQGVREIRKLHKLHLQQNKSVPDIMKERQTKANLVEPITTKTTLNKYLMSRKNISLYHLLEIDQILE